MFCNTCHNQKYVRDERGIRPCPECYGLALSCCEGTDRELDHQKKVDDSPKRVAHNSGGARFRPWSIPVGRPRPKVALRA
jgi:hypothetical protein